jgi:hypothetical protein
MGPPPKTCGTPASSDIKAGNDTGEEGSNMITFSLSVSDADQLAAVVAVLKREMGVDVKASGVDAPAFQPDNVRLLRAAT